MKLLITALVSVFMMVSVPAFAASHGGGKMDKKVDCKKKENAENKACAEKKK